MECWELFVDFLLDKSHYSSLQLVAAEPEVQIQARGRGKAGERDMDRAQVCQAALCGTDRRQEAGGCGRAVGELVHQGAAQLRRAIVGEAHGHVQLLPCLIGIAREERQGQLAGEEGAETVGLCKGEGLGRQVAVQHADQRGPLPREILQAQERNTGQAAGAQRSLDLLAVAETARRWPRRASSSRPQSRARGRGHGSAPGCPGASRRGRRPAHQNRAEPHTGRPRR